MDLSGDILIYAIGGLAFFCIAGLGIAFTGNAGTAKKRLSGHVKLRLARARRDAGDRNDPNAARKKQTQQMLKKLREQDEKRRKSLMANDIQSKIDQAGLELPAQMFWIISIVLGGVAPLRGLVFRR